MGSAMSTEFSLFACYFNFLSSRILIVEEEVLSAVIFQWLHMSAGEDAVA
jgi:hypothetical protein